MSAEETVGLQYIPARSIQGADLNPKRHDTDLIKQSIRRFGFVSPLVMNDATRRLVAGHGRLEALLEMERSGEAPPGRIRIGADGAWEVPVTVGISFEKDTDALAYLLADNKLSEAGGWDKTELSDAMRSIQMTSDLDLTQLGWSQLDINAMLIESRDQRIDFKDQDAYSESQVRQIVLIYDPTEYDRVLELFERAMADSGKDNFSEAMKALLEKSYGKGA